jgi:outer membrane protein OmpA-like peptidoglycan-associated protein
MLNGIKMGQLIKENLVHIIQKKYILLIACILLTSIAMSELQSQTIFLGDFREVVVKKNLDTLVFDRQRNEFYFGVTTGVNILYNYGNLHLPWNPNQEQKEPWNPLVAYPNEIGGGYYLGLIGEYNPVDSDWGVSLIIRGFDVSFDQTQSGNPIDSFQTTYGIEYEINYLTISPSARYNVPDIKGLHFLGGFDFELQMGESKQHITNFINGSPIKHLRNIPGITFENIRLGGHLGVGYDIFAADINNNARLFFTPYATVGFGTKLLEAYGTYRNHIKVRAGLSIKISPDHYQVDTLKYDPDYIEPPAEIANLRPDLGVGFPGFKTDNDMPIVMIAAIEKPEVIEDVAEAPLVEESESITKRPEAGRPEKILPNITKKYEYKTAEAVDLTKEMRIYLDNVADLLTRNQSATVRIVGHSDNQGTFQQNEQRAEERANQVVRYLMNKGITRGRIFSRGEGARTPIGDVRTASGRKKNRRVAITVVQ